MQEETFAEEMSTEQKTIRSVSLRLQHDAFDIDSKVMFHLVEDSSHLAQQLFARHSSDIDSPGKKQKQRF